MGKKMKKIIVENEKSDEDDDGIEIVSIGSLYKGPWDKKFWTTSRGKDRYPYPIGYRVIRAHNGNTYKLEIHQGLNGPTFSISSDDGISISGKTPDFAWGEFQKKGCPRTKIWHGKRLSSKMDGLEFFGFKNPFIQRLLRELVADINGIAERSLVSSNFGDGMSRAEHDNCAIDLGTHPDLLLCLERPHITGKRSRHEIKSKSSYREVRPHSQELTCRRASNVKNDKNLGQGSSTTHSGSDEEIGLRNHIGVSSSLQVISPASESNTGISSKNGLLLNPMPLSDDKKVGSIPSKLPSGFINSKNCKTTEINAKLSTEEEPIHGSHDAELKMSSSLKTSDDKILIQSCFEESKGRIGIDLCAPDTLDFEQENTDEVAPSNLDENAYSGTACGITSGDFLNPEHEVFNSNSNPSSDKGDFDSSGQDVAKSMISLLLPQAVPLLRNVSMNKKSIISPADMSPSRVNSKKVQNEVGYKLDVPLFDVVVVAKDEYEEQGEKIHGPNTELSSDTHNSELMKSIVFDSFEYSPCEEDFKTEQAILSSDISEAGRTSFNKGQVPICDLPKGSSMCASGLEFKDSPQDGDASIPDSILPDMSPVDKIISERSNDACSDLKENPVHASFNLMQKELLTAHDFTEGISNAVSDVTPHRMETLAEAQDEGVIKTSKVERKIMSSSKLPKYVYTRRKFRKAAPLQGNCSLEESTKHGKFELGTPPVMHTAEATLHPTETIQMDTSNGKPCEPYDSAHLHVETPQTHSVFLGGQNNLVELNPTSSQNPNPMACENKCSGSKEANYISEPTPDRKQELKNDLGSNVKFVGSYLHPKPVSSLLLNMREGEIHICVLCGLPMDQYRTLFTYKVAVKEPGLGCPSVMAHTSILLPDPKYNFMRDIMMERSGVQLTPDGQCIVLLGSIKTPSCREGKISCCCSACTSACCSEKNALKIVRVEHGYVSVVATLTTVDVVHCILVCEPNRLVSVGESGRLQVWVMNSTWSEKVENSIIPADDSIFPGIVELKRVPKCAHLVVGRNSFGEFSLWDIAKLNCVSNFSASKNPIIEFYPISLFHWQTKGPDFCYLSIEDQANKLLEATNLWHSQQRETCSFSPPDKDVAMWLLASTASEFDSSHSHVSTSSHCNTHRARSWRLALLVNNSISFGSPLDPRATGIGVSGGHGIMSTSDGLVHMWELSRGSKIGTLHRFRDGSVTCVATDDWRGGALGVAGDGGEVFLYLHYDELNSN
ncbi:PREDICTED: uncharacterized protein LOC109332026 [Lupinus angustifolius]|uniref:uncharacterized protein LOC109332026 n=1 Tax=Lupinus angustifolius TaxID=3871 RepID=UPI00092FC8B2|nr:PREDICTED: uncharacterized protein LOC109332026 [Lupinus angustifolius]